MDSKQIIDSLSPKERLESLLTSLMTPVGKRKLGDETWYLLNKVYKDYIEKKF